MFITRFGDRSFSAIMIERSNPSNAAPLLLLRNRQNRDGRMETRRQVKGRCSRAFEWIKSKMEPDFFNVSRAPRCSLDWREESRV